MGIELFPVNRDECIRGLVPQESQGQPEKQKPSSSIPKHEPYREILDWREVFMIRSQRCMEHRLHSGYYRGELRGGGDDWDEVVLHEVKQTYAT